MSALVGAALHRIAAWHRKQAQDYRNQHDGQCWAADHNPARRVRHENRARAMASTAEWHDAAAKVIEQAADLIVGILDAVGEPPP